MDDISLMELLGNFKLFLKYFLRCTYFLHTFFSLHLAPRPGPTFASQLQK